MNLQELLQKFTDDPHLFQLADMISFAPPSGIYLKNLRGSSPAFVVGGIFNQAQNSQLNHVVICDDAEAAAYFQNSLQSITNALDLFYFPSSFKTRKNFRLLNSSHVMLRTETLTRLTAGGNKKILVTYPEALFEKVVLPEALSGNIIHLKTGEVLDVDGLMEKLS